MPRKLKLTLDQLISEASEFAAAQSTKPEPTLFGVTDGKAVGTLLEAGFVKHFGTRYTFASGSAARGIDFPELKVDVKTTSIRQPQSSCPFKSAREKIYGARVFAAGVRLPKRR